MDSLEPIAGVGMLASLIVVEEIWWKFLTLGGLVTSCNIVSQLPYLSQIQTYVL